MKLHKKIASKKGYGKENFYQDKVEIIPDELIIFKHPQKKKDVYYMRFYVGDKKYKILSLRTADLKTAKLKALEKWKSLSNHLDAGGDAFEISTKESLDQYRSHLEEPVETKQIKRLTMTCKKTSLKKLSCICSNMIVRVRFLQMHLMTTSSGDAPRIGINPSTRTIPNHLLIRQSIESCSTSRDTLSGCVRVRGMSKILSFQYLKLIGRRVRRRTHHSMWMIGCRSSIT